MRLTRRASLVGLGSMGAGLWPLTPAKAAAPAFRFAFDGVRPLAKIKINDGPPVNFVMDSGTFAFGIKKEPATRLNLPLKGIKGVSGVLGRYVYTRVYGSTSLLVGDSLMVRDHELLELPEDRETRVAGLLPILYFGQALMSFGDKTFNVSSDRIKPPSDIKVLPAGKANLLGSLDRDHLVVGAVLDGQPVRLLVDTGSPGSVLLFSDSVAKLRLWNHYPKYRPDTAESISGVLPSRVARAGRLQIGDVVFDTPVLSMGDPKATDMPRVGEADGIIGIELLRRLDLWFDLKAFEIGIRPNANFHDLIRYNRAGANVDYHNAKDEFPSVEGVLQDGPAWNAGLRRGDKVLGFSGGGDVEDLQWRLMGAPGSKIGLNIDRGGVQQKIEIVLEDLI